MDVVAAAALVAEASSVVVLTGAGVSTPSGIPDFRSDGGVWSRVDPDRVASIGGFRRYPDDFWDFYDANWRTLEGYEPNDAHRVIAGWEARRRVGVITQNIDGLHGAAGSTRVAEVHGTTTSARCMRPGCPETEIEWSRLDGRPRGEQQPCPSCGGPVKPNIVLFGEDLPDEPWERAMGMLAESSLMIVVGSSLVVEPVGALPERFAAEPDTRLLVIDREATRADRFADGVLRGDCAETLVAIDRLLDEHDG